MAKRNKSIEDPEKIELRSEEVQEILGRPPKWIIKWGITVVFMVITALFIGSYFFKYPDIIPATITITTENLPVGIMAKTTGRIDALFVEERQKVYPDEILAIMENPALFEDVKIIKVLLEQYIKEASSITFPENVALGDIQQSYFLFLKALDDYRYFKKADYHHKKIEVIKKQGLAQNRILQKSKALLVLSKEQLQAAKQLFIMDSSLYKKNVLSAAEYEQSKNRYLQQQQLFENAKLTIDNQDVTILQLEQSIFDLQQQYQEQLNTLTMNVAGAYDQVSTQLKLWEQNYLIISPVEGVVTLTRFWQKNQNIGSGEVLMTVVPDKDTRITGKIILPPKGAGKVKIGQMVNVKFDNFPYMEFGMVQVQIQNIALVPIIQDKEKGYVLEVDFPQDLKTNYGKELAFSQEMQGVAEIVTEDLRLLDRFLNPIRAILKK